MRRIRFAILLFSAAALAVGCAFVVWASVNRNVDDVASRFEIKVASVPPLAPVTTVATQSIAEPAPKPTTQTNLPSGQPLQVPVIKRATKPTQTGAIVVRFSANDAGVKAFVAGHGGHVIQASDGRLVASLPTPRGSTPDKFRATLSQRSDVLYAAADEVGRFQPAFVSPTDPYFAGPVSTNNWWEYAVKAPSAWQTGFGSATTPLRASAGAIKVAVIDTGIYMDHPDMSHVLVGRDELQSYSYDTDTYTRDNDITPYYNWLDAAHDDSWHGTAVAGALGAAANEVGTVGVGYDVIPVGYKIEGPLTYQGNVALVGMTMEAAIQAIYDATNDGCKVINLSFGSPTIPDGIHQAMLDAENYAHSRGVLLVAAAGNDSNSSASYPADDPNVLSVSAVATANAAATAYTLADFSDYGPRIALTAPGKRIVLPYWSPTSGYDYALVEGTSFSAPIVSGAAAFLWRAAPALTTDRLTTLLESSATDLGAPGRDDLYGNGMVDMDAAYNQLIAQYPVLSQPTAFGVALRPDGQSLAATWTPVTGTSVTYSVSLDGTVIGSTSDASITIPGVISGTHTVVVQPQSAYNWWSATSSVSTSVSVPDAGAVPSAVTLSSAAGQVTYPAMAVSLRETTNARSSTVAVESSTDGHTWTPTGVSWANGIAPELTTRSVGMKRTTYFRLALTGATGWTNAYSASLRVPYYALLKTPSAVSTVRHGSRFTPAETISAPTHPAASTVTFKFYRWQKSGSKYAWVIKHTSRATSYTRSGNSTTYRVKTSLSKAGSYRIYAEFTGGGLYASSRSAARALRVR